MVEKVDPTKLVEEGKEFTEKEGFALCPQCHSAIIAGVCACDSEERIAVDKDVAADKAAQVAKLTSGLPPLKPPKLAPMVQADPEPAKEEVPMTEDAQDAEDVRGEPVFSAKEALRRLPGAPTDADIQTWKSQWGKIYTFPFDVNEIYIWRPLNRREWQQMTSEKALMEQEDKFQEHVVMRAVLWPKLDPVRVSASRAGFITTIFNIVMQGSYFINSELAVSLVEEL